MKFFITKVYQFDPDDGSSSTEQLGISFTLSRAKSLIKQHVDHGLVMEMFDSDDSLSAQKAALKQVRLENPRFIVEELVEDGDREEYWTHFFDAKRALISSRQLNKTRFFNGSDKIPRFKIGEKVVYISGGVGYVRGLPPGPGAFGGAMDDSDNCYYVTSSIDSGDHGHSHTIEEDLLKLWEVPEAAIKPLRRTLNISLKHLFVLLNWEHGDGHGQIRRYFGVETAEGRAAQEADLGSHLNKLRQVLRVLEG